MKKFIFILLAKFNKLVFPSLSKQKINLGKASKLQLAILGWRWYVTKNAL